MLSKKAVRRLTKLADFMESLPRSANKHFNMNYWAFNYWNGFREKDPGDYLKPKDLHTCGITACALGWATTVPAFARAGLALKVWGLDEAEVVLKGSKTRSPFKVAEEFFDIGDLQADYLFGNDAATPKQWARLCRKFIATDGKVPARNE